MRLWCGGAWRQKTAWSRFRASKLSSPSARDSSTVWAFSYWSLSWCCSSFLSCCCRSICISFRGRCEHRRYKRVIAWWMRKLLLLLVLSLALLFQLPLGLLPPLLVMLLLLVIHSLLLPPPRHSPFLPCHRRRLLRTVPLSQTRPSNVDVE